MLTISPKPNTLGTPCNYIVNLLPFAVGNRAFQTDLNGQYPVVHFDSFTHLSALVPVPNPNGVPTKVRLSWCRGQPAGVECPSVTLPGKPGLAQTRKKPEQRCVIRAKLAGPKFIERQRTESAGCGTSLLRCHLPPLVWCHHSLLQAVLTEQRPVLRDSSELHRPFAGKAADWKQYPRYCRYSQLSLSTCPVAPS